MNTAVSAKRCPECGKVTELHTAQCEDCGHQFRTRFQEPEDRTQAFDALMLPRSPAPATPPAHRTRRNTTASAFGLAFFGSFCTVALVAVLGWLAWNVSQKPAPTHARHDAVYTGTGTGGQAEDLYRRIGIAMSLYDLAQTAGNAGRVVHTSDPHVLILSYDFSGQSVRVSLFSNSLADDDYRVRAVALYRGNILLQRHADDS